MSVHLKFGVVEYLFLQLFLKASDFRATDPEQAKKRDNSRTRTPTGVPNGDALASDACRRRAVLLQYKVVHGVLYCMPGHSLDQTYARKPAALRFGSVMEIKKGAAT